MTNKKYWNKNLTVMKGYVPGYQPPRVDNLIKLNTNENPYPPSPKVFKVLQTISDNELRVYPRVVWDEMRKNISISYGVGNEQIFCGNGSDEILSLLFRSFANQGDKVVFTYPTYSLYQVLADANGIGYDYFQTNADFKINFNDLPTSGYPLAFITNPNAPTGLLAPIEELEKFIQNFEGVVVVDEAYIDFADDPKKSTALTLLNQFDNLIVMRTFSKSFSLCGIRAGYCFGNTNLIDALLVAKDSYNLDVLTQKVAKVAMEDMKWMRANAETIKESKQVLKEKLQKVGFKIIPSEANFLFVTHPKKLAVEIYDYLISKRIFVRYFDMDRLNNYLRISIGTEKQMEELVKVIQEVL